MIHGHTMGFWVAFSFVMILLIIVGVFGIGFVINMAVEDIQEWREKRRHGGA